MAIKQMDRAFLGRSEIALQASIIVTGRHKFASIEGSYHGNSIAARSVGSHQALVARVVFDPDLDQQPVHRAIHDSAHAFDLLVPDGREP